jgi:hypothetical protein
LALLRGQLIAHSIHATYREQFPRGQSRKGNNN